jgi:hypothetical protein
VSRYFYDCEFLEDGHTIQLISIGIVASDGHEYHAIVGDGDWERVLLSPWLLASVVPQLPLARIDVLAGYLAGHAGVTLSQVRELVTLDELDPLVKPRALIADEVCDFLLDGDGEAELWADHGAYDHVALCQLFGQMIDLPEGVPMFTHDVQQEAARLGLCEQLPTQSTGKHNALADAHHTRACWLWLRRQEAERALTRVENLEIERRERTEQ